MVRRVIPSLTICLAWLLLAACSGSNNPDGDPSSDEISEPESATVDPADLPPDEAAILAFEDVLAAIAEAGSIPDPELPILAEAAAGDALVAITAMIQLQVDAGTKFKGETTLHDPVIEEATPASDPVEFLLTGCVDTSTQLVVDAETEVPVEGEEYGRRLTYVLVEQVDSSWIVTDFEPRSIGTC